MQVVYNGSFVEVGKFCHIIGFVEFGWVDLVDTIGADLPLLSTG
jgi:hypothetical protein